MNIFRFSVNETHIWLTILPKHAQSDHSFVRQSDILRYVIRLRITDQVKQNIIPYATNN